MAFLAALLPAVIGAAGSIMGGINAKAASAGGKVAKEMEAQQLEQQAGQVQASAQRSALDEKKRGELIASRAIALTAAGGGGTSDPSVVNLIADIESEGAYRQAVALYQGEDQARQLKYGAQSARHEGEMIRRGGEQRQRAADWQAASYLAQGGSSLYSRYASRNPAGGTRIN